MQVSTKPLTINEHFSDTQLKRNSVRRSVGYNTRQVRPKQYISYSTRSFVHQGQQEKVPKEHVQTRLHATFTAQRALSANSAEVQQFL